MSDITLEQWLATLLPPEEWWRDKGSFLRKRGYQLRPRYQPDWIPSWTGLPTVPLLAEDAIMLPVRFSYFLASLI